MTKLITRRASLQIGAAALATPFLARGATAQTAHVVEMLNVHPENPRLRQVFFPRLIVVEPGDTVNFTATDRGHNSMSVDGMLPDGAEPWNGRINADIEVTFDVSGVYGYVCQPHATVGMVGVVVVNGDDALSNLEAVQGVRQRGAAAGIFEEIWAELAELDLSA
ncbi:MAG: plastocyanin/azurin family copper-binding protein [Pseudomonadota bacterium]